MGVCFYDTLKIFGEKKISEIDTTSDTPDETIKNIINLYKNKSKRISGNIDWLDVVYKNDDIQRFLEY